AVYAQLAVALDKPAVREDVVDVADARVQDDGADGVGPAQQRRRAAVPHDDVGLGPRRDDAQVRPAQRQPAVARRQQGRLRCRHRVREWYLPAVQRLLVHAAARALQPQARLRQDIRREGEVRVDTERGLVHYQVARRVHLAEVHLALGRDGDVLVGGAQQLRA